MAAGWQFVLENGLQGLASESLSVALHRRLVEGVKWQGKSLYSWGDANRNATWVLE